MEEEKIHNYKNITTIGAGKFATVHSAIHQPTGIKVALKKVQIFLEIMDSKERHEVVREAKLLQKVDNRHIIKCYDSWIEQGEFYICLELCTNGDLAGVIREQSQNNSRLRPAIVWLYSYQLADALRHMKQNHMMHRDVKPANVFLGEGGNLKLGDLGLGRLFSSRTLECTTVVGTPYYMAPEVMQGSPYSYPADIWSLGCVIYELCNLASPFWEKNVNLYALRMRICKGVYAPVDEIYGGPIRALVSAMVNLDTAARPDVDQVRQVCWENAVALRAELPEHMQPT